MDDTFTLYDLKVEVVASDRPMVCSHKVGDYFLVQGENLVFQKDTSFSMYSLSALLPLLPAGELFPGSGELFQGLAALQQGGKPRGGLLTGL